MTDLRYLMLFLAMSFVVEQQAQISYAEYDDLYFDGVDQPKINQKVMIFNKKPRPLWGGLHARMGNIKKNVYIL